MDRLKDEAFGGETKRHTVSVHKYIFYLVDPAPLTFSNGNNEQEL